MQIIKTVGVTLLTLLATSAVAQENTLAKALGQVDSTNLPVQKIGKEDLLNVQIIDLPELSRSYRVTNNGQIRMPMLKEMIHVEGLYPADIEVLISDELKREQLMVDPFVTVAVTEYHSRPISVTGAVKNPTVFQAIGAVNLLDAMAKAGGPSDNAGGEIIITKPNGDTGVQFTQHIQLRALMNGSDPSLNIKLTGGELITIPIVGTVVVTGNVHLSGVYPVQEGGTTTVLTAIGQAQGMGDFKPPVVYIYRPDEQGVKHEIPVDIKSILARKKADVTLQARDVLYVPDNNLKKNLSTWADRLSGVGTGAATAGLAYRKF
jgi:polysaccharide export outer membrane protein